MKYLSDYTEAAQTEAFEKFGAFFAFSKEQFENGCKKVGASEDNKVCEFGHGGYVLSKNADDFIEELNNVHKKGIELDIAENGVIKIIHRELGNYETQISGDLSNVYDVLLEYEGITKELIQQEYKVFYQKCIDNDWF